MSCAPPSMRVGNDLPTCAEPADCNLQATAANLQPVNGTGRQSADAARHLAVARMFEVNRSSPKTRGTKGGIMAVSCEPSGGIGQGHTTVNQLDPMTRQNAALAQANSAATESLKEQAQCLAQAIGVFRHSTALRR
ncbi:hypothetical protein [Hydrogenophaga sp.]|uniref:hypothetical protein n=1 Tax=Hydrogenophaga sp. TaxID=1904254 RepID=UPI003F6C4C77